MNSYFIELGGDYMESTLDNVSYFMDEIATFFDLICTPNTEERFIYISNQIKKLLCESDGGKIKILDLASGTGDLCIKLSQSEFDATGVDFSKGMIEVSNSKNRVQGANAKFILGDMREFNYKNDTYNCIYTNSLIWIDSLNDVDRMIKNVSNLLTLGGVFVIDIPNGANFLNTYKLFSAKYTKYQSKAYTKLVTYTSFPNRTNSLVSVNQTYLVYEYNEHKHKSISCDFKFRFHTLDEIIDICNKYGLNVLFIDKDYSNKCYNEAKDYQLILTK